MLMSETTDGLILALADPLRARIIELLAGEQLRTCHLVELTGARQTNLSSRLRVLREAGLVEPQPAGRYIYYRLRPAALTSLAGHYAALADHARSAAQLRRPCARTPAAISALGRHQLVNCFDCRARPGFGGRRDLCVLRRWRVPWACATHPLEADLRCGDQPHRAVEPPARVIRCGLCQYARDAADRQQHGPVQRRERP